MPTPYGPPLEHPSGTRTRPFVGTVGDDLDDLDVQELRDLADDLDLISTGAAKTLRARIRDARALGS